MKDDISNVLIFIFAMLLVLFCPSLLLPFLALLILYQFLKLFQ